MAGRDDFTHFNKPDSYFCIPVFFIYFCCQHNSVVEQIVHCNDNGRRLKFLNCGIGSDVYCAISVGVVKDLFCTRPYTSSCRKTVSMTIKKFGHYADLTPFSCPNQSGRGILHKMNKYELTVVVDGKSGAAKKKKVTESLEKILKIFKGAIKESKDWGVREMAYKIGKSDSGLYLHFEIELDGAGVKALNEKLRTDADILRYLVIRKEK